MTDYQTWYPEPEYTLGEILSRCPWIDDAGAHALLLLPVRKCGRIMLSGQIHDSHVHNKDGEYVYCTGAER